MEIIKKPNKLRQVIKSLKSEGKSVGFVPTMGYLHDGHISLIKKARNETDIVVLSIFVNPIQFAPGEDYKKYPRDTERDNKTAEKEGVDIIFAPEVSDMYTKDYSTFVEEKELSKILEGASRPTHFRGVTTVVLKLFNIIQPDISYFGQKDFQQAVIIKKMVKDLNLDTKIKVLPTVREKDGLAQSSRNTYLNKAERKAATVLYRSLTEAKKLIEGGLDNTEKVKKKIKNIIDKESLAEIDYIEIREMETLKAIKEIKKRAVILLAVRIGKVRLIDNIIISNP
jgi:pantoate--beta-alanine ligase